MRLLFGANYVTPRQNTRVGESRGRHRRLQSSLRFERRPRRSEAHIYELTESRASPFDNTRADTTQSKTALGFSESANSRRSNRNLQASTIECSKIDTLYPGTWTLMSGTGTGTGTGPGPGTGGSERSERKCARAGY